MEAGSLTSVHTCGAALMWWVGLCLLIGPANNPTMWCHSWQGPERKNRGQQLPLAALAPLGIFNFAFAKQKKLESSVNPAEFSYLPGMRVLSKLLGH